MRDFGGFSDQVFYTEAVSLREEQRSASVWGCQFVKCRLVCAVSATVGGLWRPSFIRESAGSRSALMERADGIRWRT